MIARDPDAAVYRQLARELRRQITDGELAAGQRLPSENTLIQRYGFARETVRRALRELRTEGLIVVRPGIGTWVREMPEKKVIAVPRGSEIVEARMPTAAEVAELDLPAGIPIVVLELPSGAREIHGGDRTRFTFR